MALAAAIAVAAMWTGLGVAYAIPRVPASFGVIAAATAVFIATAVAT